MRNDATEAALGLLGLNSFDPHSTIPLKRKQSSSSLSFYPAPISASSSSQQTTASESIGSGSDSINCICGFTYDDGFSIGCDSCSRWCHAACFDIVETEVPEEWRCWVCDPRPVDRERAVRIQRARQRAAVAQDDRTRRVRRVSATALDGGGSAAAKRKRRASISAQQAAEDEHIDIDEPWTLSYVPITKDLVPHPETRDRLRRVATYWRGVTALSPSSPTPDPASPAVLTPDSLPSPSPISLHPLPKSVHANPAIFSHTNPSVRPPSYAVHATHPILSSQFITPYRSTVIPSTAYLSDPLNAYAHLGMPKPFVHLFGPPLDVALDARIAGDQARFVRNGCRPNAVLRPVLCSRDKRSKARNHSKHDEDEDGAVTFGIFALRDLKAHEEVVLGWEWDDGSVIHHLPALIESPHMFPAGLCTHPHGTVR
ncbi:hypothetical protein OBBRIDRAFT_814409 [Obba rivulosa]|uniref:PHD-type domain-containing protein n=1 Tax=Obba rivulosa TaxID=1052685 RepID=A0A8E2ALI8_9APHY|nr:hypothetical protein OBBRIDRAFT_814409 [Obba rivulosa]